MSQTFFRKLPCRLIITGPFEVSVDVGVCLSVSAFHTDQHLSGTRRKFCHKHLVDHQSKSIKSWCVSTYSLVQEKNPSKCRRLQSTVGARQSHTSGPTGSEGEAHTCSNVSSVAWVSHSTETNTHSCSHTPAITLHTKKWLGSVCCENELR